MPVIAHSLVSHEVSSFETGAQLGKQLLKKFEKPPAAIVAYATINHDQSALLRGINSALSPETQVFGCSTQGVMGAGQLLETGYVAGAMCIGGEGVAASSAAVNEIQIEPRTKGRTLGAELLKGLNVRPKAVLICFDPLCSADIGLLLEGLYEVVQCPVVGGGSGEAWGPMVATYQFYGASVLVKSAVALAIGGDVSVVVGACHGTTPIGIKMTVTKSEGTALLELDGRRAIDVWTELTGEGDVSTEHVANMAIGLPDESSDQDVYRVLAPFGVDHERGGIILMAHLEVGTEIMFHHRTEQGVFEGTREMGEQVKRRLEGRKLHAVLGFECGARPAPFLGPERALEENQMLQGLVGSEASWLGMLAWGEVFPLRRAPAVFNYTFPILCLAE